MKKILGFIIVLLLFFWYQWMDFIFAAPEPWIIYFRPNWGEWIMNPVNVANHDNDAIYAPTPEFYRTWYVFYTRNTESDNSWTWYNVGDLIVESNIDRSFWGFVWELYAIWTPNVYNINYILNNWDYGDNHPTTVAYDQEFRVDAPNRTGYAFSGWKITGMNGEEHTYGDETTMETSIASTKATTFKNLHSTSWAIVTFDAQWNTAKYEVTLKISPEWWWFLEENISWKYDYGTPVEALQQNDYGLPVGTLQQNDYGLVKFWNGICVHHWWSNKAIENQFDWCIYTKAWPIDGNTQYTYAFSWWNNECGDTVTHDCTIVAEFTRTLNSYDVTFYSNGWTAVTTQNINYGSKATKPTDPFKEWYILEWWLLNWNDFDFNTPITWNITLYAKREPIEYTITYELNWWWVLSWENVTWYTIESEDITLIDPIKIWYTFIWRSGTDINGISTSVIIPTWSTWDREYEANRTANEYAIRFVDWSWTETSVVYSWEYNSVVSTEYPNWAKEWYTISWDKEIPDTMPLNGDIITASWTANEYAIRFDVDGAITTITWEYGSPVTPPTNPTKNWYKFIRREPKIPDTMPAENVEIMAVWEKLGSSGWWGWWWSSLSNTDSVWSQTWSQINSNTNSISSWTNEKELEDIGNNVGTQTWNTTDTFEKLFQNGNKNTQDSWSQWWQQYSEEFQQAYEFAKENRITTMPTIQKAQMNSTLTRIAMAKMLSQYAINILWQRPENLVVPKFNDVTEKMNSDYDGWVTIAYQLWIMWQDMPWDNFRPNDEVTRAEFGTALSRMLYNTSDGEYKWTWKYYIHHMEKLMKEWIITKDDPNMKELRGYVMIMLMRSSK